MARRILLRQLNICKLSFPQKREVRVSEKINAPDCAGFWFVCKAHPPVHINGYVLVDATQQTDQRTSQMVYLFFAEALRLGPESRKLAYLVYFKEQKAL